MNKTVKTILIVVVVVFFMLVIGCGGLAYIGSKLQTPAPTIVFPTDVPQVVQPTYTPLPTSTPYPTQKPIPTAVPPTQKPIPTDVPPTGSPQNIVIPGGAEIGCGNTQLPTGVASMRCFRVGTDLAPEGVAIIFYNSSGNPITISGTMPLNSSTYVAQDIGNFMGQLCTSVGWNRVDGGNAIQLITQPDVWYTYGSMQAKASISSDGVYMSVYVKPSGTGGGSGL